MAKSKPIAVADLGSNTVHLLIATCQDDGVHELLDDSAMLRLGDDVERDGCISAAKTADTISVLKRFKERATALDARPLHLIGTQAVRVAGGREAFLNAIESAVGVPVQVLTGEEEARLAFEGVLSAAMLSDDETTFLTPFVLIDIGGGSTQLTFGQQRRLLAARSLPVGSGRLTTRFLRLDPPEPEEYAAAAAYIAEELVAVPKTLPDGGPAPEVAYGVGGTAKAVRRVTTVTRLAGIGNESVSRGAIHVVQLRRLLELTQVLDSQRLAAIYPVNPTRARLLPAGLLLLVQLLAHFGLGEFVVKRQGIREGAVRRIDRCGRI